MALSVPVAESTRQFTAQPRKLVINGKWVEALDGETFESFDPGTGEVLWAKRFWRPTRRPSR